MTTMTTWQVHHGMFIVVCLECYSPFLIDNGAFSGSDYHCSSAEAVVISRTSTDNPIHSLSAAEFELYSGQLGLQPALRWKVSHLHVVRCPYDTDTGWKRYSYSGGFLLTFIFMYLGMLALGLSLEAMITLLTPKFIPYFVFTLVMHTASLYLSF